MTSTIPTSAALRLLHVEDNPADAELIHSRLREEWPACDIKLVANREDYLDQLTRERFDLILSDFSMPSFNGLAALEFAHQEDASVPFIFISGTLGEDNAVLALQRGAIDYVMKDRPGRLIPAMHRALALRREQQLRREAEQRLHEQAGLLEKARDAICVTDLEGRVTYWNAAAAQLFKLGDEAVSNHLLQELFRHAEPDKLTRTMRQLRSTGTWSGDLRLPGNGVERSFRHIESRWTLVNDEAGRPKSILLINTDVTEQKKLEAQLLRSQRVEGIGTLAGGIAHDLNNVLAPILMSVSLLRVSLQDDNLLRVVGVLEKSAQHGSALIRQLLAFARGTDGERADIPPQLIIRDVVTLLTDTLPRTISIETNVKRDLWQVRANSTQLVQTLINLGINARDAMPKGGRLVFGVENTMLDEAMVKANPGTKAGPHVLITVSDTGTGIPPEMLSHIFDPFFTTKASGKGTGLGLSTVVGIIKGHGGLIQVQSEVGHGTEFKLYIPAVVSMAPMGGGTAPGIAPPRGHGETILVIDDEEGVREIVRKLLTAFGFNVLVAPNGLEGVSLYRRHRDQVKVVVTDMMMPGLQGADVIKEVRSLNPDVRIVAMSGIMSELASLPKDRGRLAILSKPMTGPELVRTIQSVLPAETPSSAGL
jgi:two-component system cell cycle sensor histidine kinase/response regulator CckA